MAFLMAPAMASNKQRHWCSRCRLAFRSPQARTSWLFGGLALKGLPTSAHIKTRPWSWIPEPHCFPRYRTPCVSLKAVKLPAEVMCQVLDPCIRAALADKMRVEQSQARKWGHGSTHCRHPIETHHPAVAGSIQSSGAFADEAALLASGAAA